MSKEDDKKEDEKKIEEQIIAANAGATDVSKIDDTDMSKIDDYEKRLAVYLAKLSCESKWIANGIAKRVRIQKSKLQAQALLQRECLKDHVPRWLHDDLQRIAEDGD